MKAKNKESWDRVLAANPAGGYEGKILRFAGRWAERMEARLEWGEKVEEVAEEAIDDPELRLTSTQLCMAVVALAKHWAHGAELKSWYDKRRQTAKEKVCA